MLNVFSVLASIATAVGVILAWWQLRLSQRQARTQFEDQFAAEYRQIAYQLPVVALLGDTLDSAAQAEALAEFYWYVDLSNEQAFLRQHNRISKETWENWCDGIRSNLRRPAFQLAWNEIKRRSGSDFAELRRLEASEYRDDPATWT